ncbi:Fanconi anemia group B protein isoform X1 [Coturnix japonica]|uniref:FA complementation group B n=1 Tax=Coturnix japonica TaxID=93934 RepID=A0A8C2U8F7_COTJA|nr:Fanconi anemia group B protein isoform X1 [Coturnix japonica]
MLLSEQQHVLAYNGELLIFQLSKAKRKEGAADKTVKLCIRRMAYDRDTQLFVQKSSGAFNVPAKHSETEIVCCDCTTHSKTGIVLPCVLMKVKRRNSVVEHLLLLLHSSNWFEQCCCFKLDYELKEDIRLFAGPSVLWRHANKLFYISSDTCTVLSAPVQLSSIVWAGEIEGEGTVVLGIRAACLPESEDGDEFATSDRAIWGSEFFGYAIERQKMLTDTCFMPHAYSRVVSSVCVFKNERLKKQLRVSAVAITHKNQLIWFQDCVPKGVCELPYEKPCLIKTAVTSGNDLLFIVSFSSGNICVVRRENLQVVSKWETVKSVLVDDFIGSGTEQLLLLFNDDSNTDVLNTFKITDFGKINYESGIHYKDDVPAAEGLQENGLFTIQALETRLQAGLTSVRELQQHLGLKKRVILGSCKALVDLVEGRSHILPSAKKEGLVSLWDDAEKPYSVSKEPSLTPKLQDHFVEKLWQRVVGDSLVVGVKLTKSFCLSVGDISLSLVMDQDFSLISPIIECRNKIIKVNEVSSALFAFSCQIEPPQKKMKLDLHSKKDLKEEFHNRCSRTQLDKTNTVTAVTSLSPLLAFHRVCCAVLLHAKKQRHRNGDLLKSKRITFLCGKILLSLEDISNRKYSVNMLKDNSYCAASMEDIVAILAVSIRFTFQIVSSDCTLTRVNSWLLGEMDCLPFKECHDMVFSHKAGNIYGTVFSWTLKSPFEGVLTLFCRSLTVLFQCLHSLIRVLPPSCDVKLLKSGSKSALTEQLVLALEKEMFTSRSFLSSKEGKAENNMTRWNVPGKKISDPPMASLLDTEAGVQQFRERLQNEKEQFVLSMNETMDGTLYKEVALKVAEAQLSSDMIVWRLGNS